MLTPEQEQLIISIITGKDLPQLPPPKLELEPIHYYRACNFDHYYVSENPYQPITAIRVQHEDPEKCSHKNPHDEYESHIQILRISAGLTTLAKHLKEEDRKLFLLNINNLYLEYFHAMNNESTELTDLAKGLEAKLADYLTNVFCITNADSHKLLCMLRDLASLQTAPTDVITITELNNGNVAVDCSTTLHLRDENQTTSPFYSEENIALWCEQAKKRCHASPKLAACFDSLFATRSPTLEAIMQHANPIGPASRYSPLPCNWQENEHRVYDPEGNLLTRFDWMRTGIPCAFDMKAPRDTQYQNAKLQLEFLIKITLVKAIERFRALYGNLTNEFVIDYTSLLSPILGESALYQLYSDNNEMFVKIKNQAMQEIAAELQQEYRKKGIELIFFSPNHSVNSLAPYACEHYPETDLVKNTYQAKLELTANLFKQVEEDQCSPQLRLELAQRAKAVSALKELMNNKGKFAGLPLNFRNIIQTALEQFSLGNSALHIKGCKSARDRTAFVAAVMNVLANNWDLINDPQALHQAMIQELTRGHHFLAHVDNVALVKVSDVDKKFLKAFPHYVQEAIKKLKLFIKAFKKNEKSSFNPVFIPRTEAKNNQQLFKESMTAILNTLTANTALRDWLLTFMKINKMAQDLALTPYQYKQLADITQQFIKDNKKCSSDEIAQPLCQMVYRLHHVAKFVIPMPTAEQWTELSYTGQSEQENSLLVREALSRYDNQNKVLKEAEEIKSQYLQYHTKSREEYRRARYRKNIATHNPMTLEKLHRLIQEWLLNKTSRLQQWPGDPSIQDCTSKRGPAVLLLKTAIERQRNEASEEATNCRDATYLSSTLRTR